MTLTSDEALVLFELLHRWQGSGELDKLLLPGEQTALLARSPRVTLRPVGACTTVDPEADSFRAPDVTPRPYHHRVIDRVPAA